MKNALYGLHSSSTIVRRSAFRRAGGFYDRDRCLWGEDSYLWGQILFMGPVYYGSTSTDSFSCRRFQRLGFAVKYHDRERPLATHGLEVMHDHCHRASGGILHTCTGHGFPLMLTILAESRTNYQMPRCTPQVSSFEPVDIP